MKKYSYKYVQANLHLQQRGPGLENECVRNDSWSWREKVVSQPVPIHGRCLELIRM